MVFALDRTKRNNMERILKIAVEKVRAVYVNYTNADDNYFTAGFIMYAGVSLMEKAHTP